MQIVESASEQNLRSVVFQRAARQILRLRQERKRHFDKIEIVGPAWPLMLVLYGLDSSVTPPAVGDLAEQADLPRTTALRWLRLLQRHGIVKLAIDPEDRRVVRVHLTVEGRKGMHNAFVAAAADRRRSKRPLN